MTIIQEHYIKDTYLGNYLFYRLSTLFFQRKNSEQHLSQKYHIPIISDEIYGNLTYYGNAKFQSIIQVASKHQLYTPLIVVSGIGKQFFVPGWRVGWIVFYDE